MFVISKQSSSRPGCPLHFISLMEAKHKKDEEGSAGPVRLSAEFLRENKDVPVSRRRMKAMCGGALPRRGLTSASAALYTPCRLLLSQHDNQTTGHIWQIHEATHTKLLDKTLRILQGNFLCVLWPFNWNHLAHRETVNHRQIKNSQVQLQLLETARELQNKTILGMELRLMSIRLIYCLFLSKLNFLFS